MKLLRVFSFRRTEEQARRQARARRASSERIWRSGVRTERGPVPDDDEGERALPRGDGRRRRIATRGRRVGPAVATLATLLVLFGRPAEAAAQADLSPSETLAAWTEVRDWVRAWAIPEAPASIDPRGTVGACVTMRLGGEVVGRSTHMLGSEADENVGATIWLAARDAWREASRRLPADNDALRRETLSDFAQRITIDVQVAGALRPLAREPMIDVAARLSPGLDGAAARVGSRVEAIFPGTMLSTNADVGEALAAVISSLDLPPVDPTGRPLTEDQLSLDDLRERMGLILYSFRALHVSHTRPEEPGRFLFRGGEVVDLSNVTASSLDASARRIAEHIGAHRWPGGEPFGLLGVYRPWRGDYARPVVAEPSAQGLAAFALARYAGTLDRRGEAASAGGLRRAARQVLYELSLVTTEEEAADATLPGAALFLLALVESDALEEQGGEEDAQRRGSILRTRDACVERLLNWSEGDLAAPSPVSSVAAAALVKAGMAWERGRLVQGGARQVRHLLRSTPAERLAALSPWIGWAEIWLAEKEPIPAGVALRDFRDLVWRHQLSVADADALEPDLIGGIVFTSGANPLPTWQSLRPVALCATMLGDPRLTDEAEASHQTLRLLTSLRFLEQLIVGEAEMHMFRDRERSLGGVRLALWDQRLTLEAASIALLTLAETMDSLDALAARRADR